MIATAKRHTARTNYVRQRSGAIVLECAWRGCKVLWLSYSLSIIVLELQFKTLECLTRVRVQGL